MRQFYDLQCCLQKDGFGYDEQEDLLSVPAFMDAVPSLGEVQARRLLMNAVRFWQVTLEL